MKSRYLQKNKKMVRTLIINCVHFYYWMKPRLLLLLLLLLLMRQHFRHSAVVRRQTVDGDPLAVIEGGLPVGEGEEEEVVESEGRLTRHQKAAAAATV